MGKIGEKPERGVEPAPIVAPIIVPQPNPETVPAPEPEREPVPVRRA